MKIEWLGHACFKVIEKEYMLVIDPFHPNMIPGVNPIHTSAHMVYCTHEHDDHNHREAVRLIDPTIKHPFEVTILETYHDDDLGEKRGKNLIYLFQNDDVSFAHLGDLGCIPSQEIIDALKNVDYLMIPVGGYFTIDAVTAKEIIDMIKPEHIIPMHYSGEHFGFKVLDGVDVFLQLFKEEDISFIKGNKIDTVKDHLRKIMVFHL